MRKETTASRNSSVDTASEISKCDARSLATSARSSGKWLRAEAAGASSSAERRPAPPPCLHKHDSWCSSRQTAEQNREPHHPHSEPCANSAKVKGPLHSKHAYAAGVWNPEGTALPVGGEWGRTLAAPADTGEEATDPPRIIPRISAAASSSFSVARRTRR